jgi:hemerythrin-like metal-binding protein
MNKVEWSEALQLDYPPMDEVHHAFVDLLAQAQSAPDDALVPAWSAVIEHTVGHFGREDEWMRRTRFAAADNHMLQHRVVLNILREGLGLARSGNTMAVREMAGELAVWFAKHTQTLDAALALHMRSVQNAAPAPSRRVHRSSAAAPH